MSELADDVFAAPTVDPTADAVAGSGRVAPGLEVSLAVDGPHLVVGLHGEIDAGNVDSFHAAATSALRGDGSIRIDIGEVTFLDSSLLRALLILQAEMAISGIEVKVRNPTSQARRVFELTNLHSLLE